MVPATARRLGVVLAIAALAGRASASGPAAQPPSEVDQVLDCFGVPAMVSTIRLLGAVFTVRSSDPDAPAAYSMLVATHGDADLRASARRVFARLPNPILDKLVLRCRLPAVRAFGAMLGKRTTPVQAEIARRWPTVSHEKKRLEDARLIASLSGMDALVWRTSVLAMRESTGAFTMTGDDREHPHLSPLLRKTFNLGMRQAAEKAARRQLASSRSKAKTESVRMIAALLSDLPMKQMDVLVLLFRTPAGKALARAELEAVRAAADDAWNRMQICHESGNRGRACHAPLPVAPKGKKAP